MKIKTKMCWISLFSIIHAYFSATYKALKIEFLWHIFSYKLFQVMCASSEQFHFKKLIQGFIPYLFFKHYHRREVVKKLLFPNSVNSESLKDLVQFYWLQNLNIKKTTGIQCNRRFNEFTLFLCIHFEYMFRNLTYKAFRVAC